MASILICPEDNVTTRGVAAALAHAGHTVSLEGSGSSALLSVRLAHFDVVVLDLTASELQEGELLNISRIVCGRTEPGLLVVGIAEDRLPHTITDARIVVLSAPFCPSQVVEAVTQLDRERRQPIHGGANSRGARLRPRRSAGAA